MKIALAYDRINKWGGAEQVLLSLHKIWPEAPLYTSVYNPKTAQWAKEIDVRTTFIQNLPTPKDAHEKYPFLMGIAFENLKLDEFDVVISVTSEFAKAIITGPNTFHLCYCLNPTGYLWSGYDQYFSGKSMLYKSFSKPIVEYLRWYDKVVCHRPDKYVSISNVVSDRVKKYYGINSEVIYPPVKIKDEELRMKDENYRFKNANEEYYLIVSRLVPNKRIDIAIKAFNELGIKLKIVGVGKERTRLESMANSNIEFLGNLTEGTLSTYYRNSLGLIVPAEEDFGIVSVEAQSFGKSVIAFGKGGSLETVVEGKTGWFFKEPNHVSLRDKILEIKNRRLSPNECWINSKRFDEKLFQRNFKQMVEKSYREYKR